MLLYCVYTIYTVGDCMDIVISNSDKKPFYEQIEKQIKRMIITGTLKGGDLLPSMRLLAKELRVSVITTKRAYEELERDGVIETVAGKGSYVAEVRLEVIIEEKRNRVLNHINNAVAAAKLCKMTKQELHELVDKSYKTWEELT